MKRIPWKLMRIHSLDYSGNCRYCGGSCKCQRALDARLYVGDILRRSAFYDYAQLPEMRRYTYRQLYNLYESTLLF